MLHLLQRLSGSSDRGRARALAVLMTSALLFPSIVPWAPVQAQENVAWNLRGGAAADIAIAPDGTAWYISASAEVGRWNNDRQAWDIQDGTGQRITIASDGTPWIINNSFEVLQGPPGNWQVRPGKAGRDIAAGADGSIWIVGTDNVPYKWSGTDWEQQPGQGAAIAVAPDGTPWIVTQFGEVFQGPASNWQKRFDGGVDIGIGSNGTVWIIGQGGRPYRWNGTTFDGMPGSEYERIAVGADGLPWTSGGIGGVASAVPAPAAPPQPTAQPTNAGGTGGAAGGAGGGAGTSEENNVLLNLINQWRAQNGRGPLVVEQRLQAAADWHANDQANAAKCLEPGKECDHTDTTGREFDARFRDFGYPAGTVGAAENVATGWPTPQAVFEAWKNSPGHNANMLNPDFKGIGLGRVCNDQGRCAWVNTFGAGL